MPNWVNDLVTLLKQFWPALLAMFFGYEEDRVDHAEKEKEAAQLAASNLQDEKNIRAQFEGKSDADVIKSIAGESSTASGTDTKRSS